MESTTTSKMIGKTWTPNNEVTTIEELREMIGFPRQLIAGKETPYLTPLLAEFISQSPYFMLATAADDGTCDVSPRGDPAGAVLVFNEYTIVLADRPGNKRIDSLENIIKNPHVGLLFIIPGTDEVLRVNGKVTLTRDPELLAQLAQRGKEPQLAMVVHVEGAYTHCARSILRSKIWDPETWPDTDTIPTLQEMLAEQLHLPEPDQSQGKRTEEYRTRLY